MIYLKRKFLSKGDLKIDAFQFQIKTVKNISFPLAVLTSPDLVYEFFLAILRILIRRICLIF